MLRLTVCLSVKQEPDNANSTFCHTNKVLHFNLGNRYFKAADKSENLKATLPPNLFSV